MNKSHGAWSLPVRDSGKTVKWLSAQFRVSMVGLKKQYENCDVMLDRKESNYKGP